MSNENDVNVKIRIDPPEVDAANMRMGVDGYGEFVLRGTNEFVQKAMAHILPVVQILLMKHVEQETTKGRDIDEVGAEFLGAMDKAAKEAGIDVGAIPAL